MNKSNYNAHYAAYTIKPNNIQFKETINVRQYNGKKRRKIEEFQTSHQSAILVFTRYT